MLLSVFSDLWYIGDWELESWSFIIYFLLLVFGLVTSYLATVHANDMVVEEGRGFNKRKVKTAIFKAFAFSLAVSIILTVLGKIIDNKIAKQDAKYAAIESKRISDSTANAYTDTLRSNFRDISNILGAYGFSLRETNDSLRYALIQIDKTIKDKIETSKKEPEPTLTIPETPTITENNNRLFFKYRLSSYNADAHIVNYRYIVINLKSSKNDMLLIDGEPYIQDGGSINQTNIISYSTNITNEENQVIIFLDKLERKSDEMFLIIDFTYKSKSGKLQEPMRMAYQISLSGKLVISADISKYDKIKEILKSKGFW